MKKLGFLEKARMIVKVALRYSSQHCASLAALDRPYRRTWDDPNKEGRLISSSISITPCGSLYKVYEATYHDGQLVNEETRLATYGWHSNGHLIEIAGTRYWIIDSLGESLYVDDYNDEDLRSFDVYVRM